MTSASVPASNRDHHVPRGTSTFGMVLFLAALAMLFIASMAIYAILRITGANAPELHTFTVPTLLWASTVVILISSVTIQHALSCVQHQKLTHFRISMGSTMVLTIIFVFLQIPAMYLLINEQQTATTAQGGVTKFFLFMLLLVGLHALHVIGGLIPLVITFINALAGKYDHEHYDPVRNLTLYWHFLDAVWITMFLMFLVLG